jgi:hypothetical protein
MNSELLNDLKRLPGFDVLDGHYNIGVCDGYYLRWKDYPNISGYYIVQFSVRKCFDKWGNSVNFETKLQYESGTYRADLVKSYEWMNKVVESGLFNFNSYFDVIQIPFFALKNE